MPDNPGGMAADGAGGQEAVNPVDVSYRIGFKHGREGLLRALNEKLDELRLHDDTGHPHDEGYMACLALVRADVDSLAAGTERAAPSPHSEFEESMKPLDEIADGGSP